MKKSLKILGLLAAVCLTAILTVPFFIDVDRFRPEIARAVDERIQGKFELGKLSLSLWGRIHVGIDGLKLTDSKGMAVLAVKDASFDLPYLSVFSGSPLITLGMREPEISVLKDMKGRLNVMDFVQTGPGTPAAASTDVASRTAPSTTEAQKTAPAKALELPALVLNARFGLSIQNAKVSYRDDSLALSNRIDRLNLRVKDFSLSRPTEAELQAEINTGMGPDLSVRGPLRAVLELSPDSAGGELKGAAVKGTISADDLEISKGDLFSKKKGIPARVRFDAFMGVDSVKIQDASLVFHNAEVGISGSHHFLNGADFRFEAKPIELKAWSELVPMLKDYELEGRLSLKGEFKGKPETISYQARLGIEAMSAKGPMLKAKPVLNGALDVQTDRIEKLTLRLTAPGNSLDLEAKLASFAKPRISFQLKSGGMDLDQWIDFPKKDSKTAAAKADSAAPATDGTAGSKSAAKTDADFDAMLAPLRKNAMAAAAALDGTVAIAFVKAMGFRMDALSANISMKNLVVSLSEFKMKMFDGALGGSLSTDLKPAAPSYVMKFSIDGLDMQKAVESQFASFKNTLTGKLSAGFSGSGASFNAPSAKRNLNAKGDFKVVNGGFQSIDVAKMANEAIAGSLAKVAEKVPVLKGREWKLGSNAGSRYEIISGSFTIKGGVLEAPDFYAKAAPKAGIDLRGYTRMGLLDESLDARWQLTDSQRVTGADRLSVDVGGRTITNFLAKSESEPVTLPVTVGCKWSAPCTSYTQVPEHLAGIAAARLTGAAKEAVKDVVKQKVQEQVQKQVKDALKGLFGR